MQSAHLADFTPDQEQISEEGVDLADFTPHQEQISEEDADHTRATEAEPFQRPCLLIVLHVAHPEP